MEITAKHITMIVIQSPKTDRTTRDSERKTYLPLLAL